MMGTNQIVGKGHTKWFGGSGCGSPVAQPWFTLINYCVIAFSFALMFTIGWFA